MRRYYYSMEDVWSSPWAKLLHSSSCPEKTDRIFRSTKLEDSIFRDLRNEDSAMDTLEAEAKEKLSTFPALSRDIFQAFYSLLLRRNDDVTLSSTAQKVNKKILDQILTSSEYPTIKSICEGRELPAYEAAAEFAEHTAEDLDKLLANIGGKTGAIQTLEKLQSSFSETTRDLSKLLTRIHSSEKHHSTWDSAAISAANKAESKRRQIESVEKLIAGSTAQHKDSFDALVSQSLSAAADRAQEVGNILGAWSDTPADLTRSSANEALLARVRNSSALQMISRYLGRYRDLFSQYRKNAYTFGRGEKYTLELGNDLTRAITSELAMLAMPQTTPLFLRKLRQKRIKQYCRREPICKGMGDIICCLDESGSTAGETAAWGKAVAMTLLEIATNRSCKFALIHFSNADSCQVDLFIPGSYTVEDKLRAAETFLGGGTNFETPLKAALSVMEDTGFSKADVVFITDGCCRVSDTFLKTLSEKQRLLKFSVTGILMDTAMCSDDSSLTPFCNRIYRTSEMLPDNLVNDLICQRI